MEIERSFTLSRWKLGRVCEPSRWCTGSFPDRPHHLGVLPLEHGGHYGLGAQQSGVAVQVDCPSPQSALGQRVRVFHRPGEGH